VQWCRGLDGLVDPARIAREARRLADPDVLCLQEVSVGFADLSGSRGENQVEALERELPGYAVFFASAVDVPGEAGTRLRFGNVVASRLPVGRVLRHARHRAAQIERLRELHGQGNGEREGKETGGPFRPLPRPPSAIVCGDFNLPPGDPLHGRFAEGFSDGAPRLVDAWEALHPGEPHAHTFGVHERDEGEAAYCCDYVFVSEDLQPRLKSIAVDGANRASDHQPVILSLE